MMLALYVVYISTPARAKTLKRPWQRTNQRTNRTYQQRDERRQKERIRTDRQPTNRERTDGSFFFGGGVRILVISERRTWPELLTHAWFNDDITHTRNTRKRANDAGFTHSAPCDTHTLCTKNRFVAMLRSARVGRPLGRMLACRGGSNGRRCVPPTRRLSQQQPPASPEPIPPQQPSQPQPGKVPATPEVEPPPLPEIPVVQAPAGECVALEASAFALQHGVGHRAETTVDSLYTTGTAGYYRAAAIVLGVGTGYMIANYADRGLSFIWPNPNRSG